VVLRRGSQLRGGEGEGEKGEGGGGSGMGGRESRKEGERVR